MDEDEDDYGPWVDGYLAGYHGQIVPAPTDEQWAEWEAGFVMGCTELGEYHRWERLLDAYLLRMWWPGWVGVVGVLLSAPMRIT
jgi:hypothetical protein